MPRRLRRAHGADRRPGRLRDRLHLRLLGQRQPARRARLRLRHPDRDGGGRALGLQGLRGAGDRRRRHRLWQPAQRDPHRHTTSRTRAPRACFLEDQVWPKKCGHMAGKEVVPDRGPRGQAPRRPADARGERDLFVVARTDARQPLASMPRSSAASPTRRPAPTRSSSRRRTRSRSWRRSPTSCRGRWSRT